MYGVELDGEIVWLWRRMDQLTERSLQLGGKNAVGTCSVSERRMWFGSRVGVVGMQVQIAGWQARGGRDQKQKDETRSDVAPRRSGPRSQTVFCSETGICLQQRFASSHTRMVSDDAGLLVRILGAVVSGSRPRSSRRLPVGATPCNQLKVRHNTVGVSQNAVAEARLASSGTKPGGEAVRFYRTLRQTSDQNQNCHNFAQ